MVNFLKKNTALLAKSTQSKKQYGASNNTVY